jgi:hypothetical protein
LFGDPLGVSHENSGVIVSLRRFFVLCENHNGKHFAINGNVANNNENQKMLSGSIANLSLSGLGICLNRLEWQIVLMFVLFVRGTNGLAERWTLLLLL